MLLDVGKTRPITINDLRSPGVMITHAKLRLAPAQQKKNILLGGGKMVKPCCSKKGRKSKRVQERTLRLVRQLVLEANTSTRHELPGFSNS